MTKGTFEKLGKSGRILYGPRGMLVGGFNPEDQKVILGFLERIQLKNLPVIFVSEVDKETLIKDLISRPDRSGWAIHSNLDRIIILSGISESEFHQTLSTYRTLRLPRPLWATLTPTSESWHLSALIEELRKERSAMEKKTIAPILKA
jgi:hypothetical protein